MCMEDYRIGRRIAVTEHFFVLDGTAQLMIDDSPDRVFLHITTSSTGATYIGLNPSLILGQGMNIKSTLPPLYLDVKIQGQLVTKKMFAIGPAATIVYWIEGILLER